MGKHSSLYEFFSIQTRSMERISFYITVPGAVKAIFLFFFPNNLGANKIDITVFQSFLLTIINFNCNFFRSLCRLCSE
jgi:hypothetical protein